MVAGSTSCNYLIQFLHSMGCIHYSNGCTRNKTIKQRTTDVFNVGCPFLFVFCKCSFEGHNERGIDVFDKATKNLTQNELTIVSYKFRRYGKKKNVAYLLWAVGGVFGLHRAYVGDYRTALILMAVTVFTCGVGAVAGLYDVVNISRLIDHSNKDYLLKLVKDVKRK
jgi:TM2 domain-containing membrane protein YozV